jgi:transcriptional regulator with XRE-family HTH domain
MITNNLKSILKEKEMSQLELSRRTGIGHPTINGIVNCRIVPYPGWRKKIAKALDVPESKLFPGYGREGDESSV